MEHRTVALIVAAGRGQRAEGSVPKQYRRIGGRPVIAWTLDIFLRHPSIDAVRVMIHPDDVDLYAAAVPADVRLLPPALGGDTRQETVRLGLESLLDALPDGPPDRVLIHDAARPFVPEDVLNRVLAALADYEAALPACPVTDTLQRVDAAGYAFESVPREGLFAAETPQGFHFPAILAAHRRAAAAQHAATDDAMVAAFAGLPVKVVAGDRINVKLTTPEDFDMAESRLAAPSARLLDDIRVGTGYDVHPLGPGEFVMLGGVRIASDTRLLGHSDADVALHALTDAVLGAIADGDIGSHFPPSDPAWKGASSDRFLAHAAGLVARRGGVIAHLDVAIVAEAPKIAPHRDAMRARIAEICGLAVDRVSVKATTNERLGFVGRNEGIAAIATATVRLPLSSVP